VVSTFRWMDRYVSYCVSVVETSDAAGILAGFGADPHVAVRGDFRDAIGFHSDAGGYHPVVQVVDRGQWSVVIEHSSFESLRPEVLRRLPGGSRTVGVALRGDADRRIFYAENGDVVGPFAAPTRTSEDWPHLEVVADRAGVSLESWSDGNVPRSSIELVEQVCGFPITDEIMKAPGLIGLALPRLPDPSEVLMPVGSDADAQLFAIVESAADDDLRPAVSRQTHAMLVEAGVIEDDLLAAVTVYGAGGTIDASDESPVGTALRRLLAEERLIIGDISRPADEIASLRRRVSVGLVANTLLRAGARAAVAEMVHRRPNNAWERELVAALSSVEVTASAAAVADARLSEVGERRARSTAVPASLFKARDGNPGGRTQAVSVGKVQPEPSQEGDDQKG
jgi:hypothetical protein